MKIILIILLLISPAVAQRRLTVNAAVSRTSRFERRFEASQFSAAITANYRLKGRLSMSFGIVQPIQNRWFSYRTSLIWRIY